MDIKDMRFALMEYPETRRNRDNYDEDVLTHDAIETGVREYSTLNAIPYFHVTESSAEDITHTVEEGIVKYNIAEALYFLIFIDNRFTLNELINRMKTFSYGEEEKVNKAHRILKDHLVKGKLKMTAAETSNFIQNITFIIGDLVPEENIVWPLILQTVKFFDFCYLPCYEQDDIREWREIIFEMHDSYIEIFGDHLKPHHHFATHFPADTEKFGPLRYVRTIRYYKDF